MNRRTQLKAGCGLLAVFAAGFLCGGLALFLLLTRIVPLSDGWRDDESKTFVTNHLAKQLGLSPAQIEAARPIIHRTLNERYERRKAYVKDDVALTGQSLSAILPLLDEGQKAKAEAIFQHWKKGKARLIGK